MKRKGFARAAFMALCIGLGAVAFQHIAWGALWTRGLFSAMSVSITAVVAVCVWTLVWETRVAAVCTYGLMCAGGYLYECVWLFRGAAFKPLDVVNVATAWSVAGSYAFPFTLRHALWLACGVGLALLAGWVPRGKGSFRSRGLCMAAALGWLAVLLLTPLLDEMGVESTAYEADAKRINTRYGTLPTLVYETRQLLNSRPAGYDPEALEQACPGLASAALRGGTQRPNVVVIVSESLMRPERLWQMTVSEEPMPFLDALENTVRGSLYVSSYGGKTSDTEHSFLTGTAPAPYSTQPLLATVKRPTPSLAWQLKGLGYRTLAIHPFIRENYQRPVLYPRLGFDAFLSEEAFPDAERLRGYVSDRACYERIMEAFRTREAGERLFVYAVTMQNHGPYPDPLPEEPLHVNGEEQHPELKTYLNLLRHSDEALEALIRFFEESGEPTVVLLFGDHQARLDLSGYEPRPGRNEVEETLRTYRTPFVLWSNLPLARERLEALSVNYLAALLLQKAGLPMTAYDEWLLQTAEQYPVVVAGGYADREGKLILWNEGCPERLAELQKLHFNRLHDSQHRLLGLNALLPEEKRKDNQ